MNVIPDPGFAWLLAMCRCWLMDRAGRAVEPMPVALSRADEWAVVETLARVHSVEPILFSLAGRAPFVAVGVPHHVRARWEKAYYSHRIRNAEALTVLAQLVAGCAHMHAPILALKGPAAMADVYRDIGLRPMADLDLLCRPGDLVRVARIARSLGFGDGSPYLHHVVLRYGGDTGGLLELHFDLHREVADRAHFIDSAWQHQATGTIEEWTFPVMSREDQLVFDVAHWVHHDFDLGLKHVMDFAGRLLVHRDDLDWPRLAALLDQTELLPDFEGIVGAIEALLQLSLAIPKTVRIDVGRADHRTQNIVNRMATFGTTAASVPGGGVPRQSGAIRKTTYVWRRLFPPLLAAQAAFDSPTRIHALAYLPIHAGKEIIDLIARAAASDTSVRRRL